jgi:hypothetical protein
MPPPEEKKTNKQTKGLQSFIADVRQKQTKKRIQFNTELPRGLQQEPLCQNSIILSSGERKSTAQNKRVAPIFFIEHVLCIQIL